MKKTILFILPVLLSIVVFLAILFFLGEETGKGALQVTATPDSTVYLNDVELGRTPLSLSEGDELIEAGEYAIKIVPDDNNLSSFEEKITINKSTLTVVDKVFSKDNPGSSSIISLSPISNDEDAELLVISSPNEASVFLDNNPVGVTPLSLNNQTTTDHTLSIAKKGYEEKSIGVKTVLGYKLTVNVTLNVAPIESSPSAKQETDEESENKPATTANMVEILDTPTGFLRVREASTTASIEITRVNPGDTFELLSEGDGWYEIILDDEETGWVSAQYARIEEQN